MKNLHLSSGRDRNRSVETDLVASGLYQDFYQLKAIANEGKEKANLENESMHPNCYQTGQCRQKGRSLNKQKGRQLVLKPCSLASGCCYSHLSKRNTNSPSEIQPIITVTTKILLLLHYPSSQLHSKTCL